MPLVVLAQGTLEQRLAFEVATIRPSSADQQPSVNFTLGPGDTYTDTGGLLVTKGISLLDYIRFAYTLSDGQVELLKNQAPAWINTKRFDMTAKSPAPHPSKNDMRRMMRALLMERFGLQTHIETRNTPVLALVQVQTGATGPSLHLHTTPNAACEPAPPDPSRPSISTSPSLCGGIHSSGVPSAASRVRLTGSAVSMSALAAQLSEMGGFTRPVVDQTGLSGTFDFSLEWGPESTAEPTDDTSREGYLQEALRKQLGLRLDRRTAPFRVLFIDHVDRQPSQN